MISYEVFKDFAIYYGKMSIELFGIYFFWIILHYVSAHLYAYYCAQLSAFGFIMSPFIVPAPHCQAFRWIIINGSNIITTMWITLGTWIAKRFVL